jgi:hypothetical protein
MWVVFDLTPDLRYKKRYVLPGGIIPGPKNPKNTDSFLFPGFHHLSAIQKEGLCVWDGKDAKTFSSRPFLHLGGADGPGSVHFTGLVSHHGAFQCRLYCDLKGRHVPGAGPTIQHCANPTITLSSAVIILMWTQTASQAALQLSTIGTCSTFSNLGMQLNIRNAKRRLELHIRAFLVAYPLQATNPFQQDFPVTVCMDPHSTWVTYFSHSGKRHSDVLAMIQQVIGTGVLFWERYGNNMVQLSLHVAYISLASLIIHLETLPKKSTVDTRRKSGKHIFMVLHLHCLSESYLIDIGKKFVSWYTPLGFSTSALFHAANS